MLAWSHYETEDSRDQPVISRFSVVFLVPRANTEFEPNLHLAFNASNSALLELM